MSDNIVWIGENTALLEDAEAIMVKDSSAFFDEKNLSVIEGSDYRVAPWGLHNLLPQEIMAKSEQVEIIGTNCDFNARVCYGNGPKLARLIRDERTNKVVDYYDVTEGKEYDWFVNNNVPQLVLEMLTDLSYFANAFPCFVFNKDFTEIKRILHREAMFARWGLDKEDQIKWLLYSSKWDQSPGSIPAKADIEKSFVIDEFSAVKDIEQQMAAKYYRRVCMALYLPSPGRPYYSYPNWYSVFRSGWYDQIGSIPEMKKAILKYNLGIRYIIYVSDKYFQAKEQQAGISPDDIEARKKLRDKIAKELNDFAVGAENQGKSMTVLKEMTGQGSAEEKYITIETIKNEIKEGEFLTDYETVANIISYAMEVHPSLIGATPGKNSNSLSGSNIREIYLMKQAQMRPFIDLVLRPFSIVKKINKWDSDISVVLPEYIFTTLDQNKSGKQESTNSVAQ